MWQIPVTTTLDRMLEEAVRADTHVSKSDFVREAVRARLREMGFEYRYEEPVANRNEVHARRVKSSVEASR